jgi:ATP-binding cassette subfamily C protein LapB
MHENSKTVQDDKPQDNLLACLVFLTSYYQRPYSAQALRADLPIVDEIFTPQLFIRAAENIGLKAKLVKRDIEDISNLVLPAVLLLKANKACLLIKRNSNQTVDLIYPESSEMPVVTTVEELRKEYTGSVILIQQTYRFNEPEEDTKEFNGSAWFWKTLFHYRAAYIKVMLAAFLINIFALLGPLYIMNVYDRVVSNRVMVTLWVLSLGIITVYIFDFILRLLRSYVVDVIGKKSDILMASEIFKKVLNLQLTQKPASVGYFVSNLREFEVLREFFSSATLVTLIDFPFVILYIILLGYIGGYIIFVPLVAIPAVILISVWLNKPLQGLVDDVVTKSNKKHGVLVETVGGLEVIKGLAAESTMQRKWEHYVGEGAKISLQSKVLSSLISTISIFIQQLLVVGIIIVGVYEITNNNLTLGGLVACSILGGRIMAPLSQLVGLLTRYQQAKKALNGLNKLMSLPVERSTKKRYLQLPMIRGEIEFKNVSFKYPRQENKALDNVSFKISAGEHVGILGRVGSGKSTIQKLILGLFQPNEGTVYIDGVDISQLDTIDIRKNIGYVPQENILFTGTVRENILMGKPTAKDPEVIRAAQLSGAERFIKEHPHGYHWQIAERGEGLSGGQRQSIAISRALIGNAPILLFDEPTSSIDDTSEQELISNLLEFTKDKTFILVTHRITLLRLVTRIMVMVNGKLVADGPRDEILKRLQTPPSNTQGKPA